MITFYVGAKRHTVDPDKPLGMGGEARVYDIGGDRVAKIYHDERDPMLAGDGAAQRAARQRIDMQQRKLPDFPRDLPPQVVAPLDLVRASVGGRIIGYTMARVTGGDVLLRLSMPKPRQGVLQADVTGPLRSLRVALAALHAAGVVAGDFNDQNVIVTGSDVRLIDADSFQFGAYPCATYTCKFVDPTLCVEDAAAGGAPQLAKPHNVNGDWYAFAVMVMNTFCLVDPYGGVYVAPPGSPKVPHVARPLHRITVFSPHVKYPRPAISYGLLPDDMLAHFHATFERDVRGVFPASLLESLRWTTCSSCGAEHARARCPKTGCGTVAPAVAPVVTTTQVRGTVTATTVYARGGVILRVDRHVGVAGRRLMYLSYENGGFRREDGAVVVTGPIDRAMRYRCAVPSTFLAKGNRVFEFAHGNPQPARSMTVDTVDGAPMFQTDGERVFWCDQDALWSDATATHGGSGATSLMGPHRIGDVLGGQTRFWVGPRFGLGFYRAGAITRGFVFGTASTVINDGVALHVVGKLLDATCVFDDADHAWLLTTTEEGVGARRVNRCVVVHRDGRVVATAEADVGDGSWLASIRGGAAVGMKTSTIMLTPTDAGVVRVEPQTDGTIITTKAFPDTEPFVDAGSRLVVADAMYVVATDGKKIRRVDMQ